MTSLNSKESSGPCLWVTRWEKNSASQGMPCKGMIINCIVLDDLVMPTHDKEELDNNHEVPLCLGSNNPCGIAPVLHKIIDRQQEEEDIGRLEGDNNAVKINKLRAGEECSPLAPRLVVGRPLVSPGVAKETLGHAHVGPRNVARAKLLDEGHHSAEEKRHPLQECVI